jgi:hypothetical protein
MEQLLAVLQSIGGDLEGTGYDDDYVRMLEEMVAGAPDLDELEKEAGGPPIDDDFKGRLLLIVDPSTLAAWKRHRESYEDDDTALAELLGA